jgi:hypothetical protein
MWVNLPQIQCSLKPSSHWSRAPRKPGPIPGLGFDGRNVLQVFVVVGDSFRIEVGEHRGVKWLKDWSVVLVFHVLPSFAKRAGQNHGEAKESAIRGRF